MEYIGISLQEYLIKYSGVNKDFIKEFIAIQQSDILKEHYPFVVDFDLIVKWLRLASRDELVKTLKRSYTENIDFVIMTPVDSNGSDKMHGGDIKQIIYLTVPAFKKICIKTKSQFSEQIINYYIALEDLLIKYQQYVVSVLIKENKLLKNDLNNEIFPVGGLVYVLDLDNGYFKFGKTNDLKLRKQVYDTGSIHKHKVAFWFESDNISVLENCVKSLLKPLGIRKNKEVYCASLKKIIEAIEGCERLAKNIICNECESQPIISNKNISKHYKSHHHKMMNKKLVMFSDIENQTGGTNDNFNKNSEYYREKHLYYKAKYIEMKKNSI